MLSSINLLLQNVIFNQHKDAKDTDETMKKWQTSPKETQLPHYCKFPCHTLIMQPICICF